MRKVVFLDRDGTINVDRGFVFRIDDWEFAPGAIDGLRLLRSAGFALAVVSNQSGIAPGLYTTDDVARLHEHAALLLGKQGITLDAIAICPHAADEGCDCRKPRTDMARQIEARLGEAIDMSASWTVGDKPADVEFGLALGTRTVLLESRYWTSGTLQFSPTHIAATLLEAARMIMNSQAAADRLDC